MFITSWCPYCKAAYPIMEELKEENAAFRNLDIKIVDEELEPDFAKQFDYYYVPTYYVNGVKAHEGSVNKDILRNIFESALK
jgi:thiol-disulfide isomerase/thioredoxin